MSRFAHAAGLALCLVLAACTPRTRDIPPSEIDASMFIAWDCPQLSAERAKRSQALIFSGLEQDHIAESDRMRTFGAPTPMGTIFEGTNMFEIARLKGELRALNAHMGAMHCEPDYR